MLGERCLSKSATFPQLTKPSGQGELEVDETPFCVS
jgi:hypothetical protein